MSLPPHGASSLSGSRAPKLDALPFLDHGVQASLLRCLWGWNLAEGEGLGCDVSPSQAGAGRQPTYPGSSPSETRHLASDPSRAEPPWALGQAGRGSLGLQPCGRILGCSVPRASAQPCLPTLAPTGLQVPVGLGAEGRTVLQMLEPVRPRPCLQILGSCGERSTCLAGTFLLAVGWAAFWWRSELLGENLGTRAFPWDLSSLRLKQQAGCCRSQRFLSNHFLRTVVCAKNMPRQAVRKPVLLRG